MVISLPTAGVFDTFNTAASVTLLKIADKAYPNTEGAPILVKLVKNSLTLSTLKNGVFMLTVME